MLQSTSRLPTGPNLQPLHHHIRPYIFLNVAGVIHRVKEYQWIEHSFYLDLQLPFVEASRKVYDKHSQYSRLKNLYTNRFNFYMLSNTKLCFCHMNCFYCYFKIMQLQMRIVFFFCLFLMLYHFNWDPPSDWEKLYQMLTKILISRIYTKLKQLKFKGIYNPISTCMDEWVEKAVLKVLRTNGKEIN